MNEGIEKLHSGIWSETAETDNPFAAAVCRCSGYDVYGELLGKAGWIEYLYLLFMRERPDARQTSLLTGLAVALANPGPRDASVHAAMSAGAGGSTRASCLMAALAVGAGQLGGAHEVSLAMEIWQACGQDLAAWQRRLQNPPREERADIWPAMQHAPGFDPHGASCATPVRQTLAYLAACSPGTALPWLQAQRKALEEGVNLPLAMSGIAAAAMTDLGLRPAQGEMLCLLLRLPGAAVHALEQEEAGWRNFPFFGGGLELLDDPVQKQPSETGMETPA
jgi:citrate synthase